MGLDKGTLMASTFTEITADTDLQDKDLHNEIRAAFNERYYAHTESLLYSANVAAGDDIQAQSYWQTYQDDLESMATSAPWFDPTFDPDGETGISNWDLSDWRTAADIPSGFRRVTGSSWPADWTDYNDPAYTYGTIQVGDIIGPWLFVDLQRGLNALTHSWWQLQNIGQNITGATRSATGSDSDCQTALDEANNNWDSASWGGSAVQASVSIYGDTDHDFVARREKVKPKSQVYILYPSDTEYDIYLYAAPSGTTGYNPDLRSTYGYTNDVWNLTSETDTEVSTTTWESDTYFGEGFDDSPLDDAGVTCPISNFNDIYTIVFYFTYVWTFKYHL